MRPARVALTLGLTIGFAASASAATPLKARRIISGITNPIYVTAPPGDANRIFVVEQRGNPSATSARILVYSIPSNPNTGTYTLLGTFMTVSPVTSGSEQGLLGMAFDPRYMTNGVFYIDFTNSSGTTTIQRFVDSDPTDSVYTGPAGALILSLAQPFTNHNSGWIGFSPIDGYLYIPQGDGGSACDPSQRAQNLNVLLGKINRIDPDGPDNIPGNADDDEFPADPNKNYAIPPTNPYVGIAGEDEIFDYGVRNPWRDSFDRLTGDLYIGDVGQNRKEEISFHAAGDPGGKNFGWDCYEGFDCANLSSQCVGTTNGCTCTNPNPPPAGIVMPIHDYDQTIGSRAAVTGGYVYRGPRIPDLQGTYFFADYASAEIWSFVYTGTPSPPVTVRQTELAPGGGVTINLLASFGEDADGELYICDTGGEVFKIIVDCAGSAIAINPHPANQTLCVGDTLNLSVGATGMRGAVTYVWKRGVTVVGGNSPNLTLNNVQLSDAGSYTCDINDQCNTVTSNAAVVTINDDPGISDQPDGATACAGADVSFTVGASGGALSYDWRHNTVSLGAPSSPTLSLTNVQAGDAGDYDVIITNNCGNMTSDAATLTIVPSPPAGDISGDCVLTGLDRTLFVNVLLGTDSDSGHVTRSDLNNSGIADGDDIPLFVALPVPP